MHKLVEEFFKLLDASGFNDTEFIERSGFTRSTLVSWKKGSVPKIDSMDRAMKIVVGLLKERRDIVNKSLKEVGTANGGE